MNNLIQHDFDINSVLIQYLNFKDIISLNRIKQSEKNVRYRDEVIFDYYVDLFISNLTKTTQKMMKWINFHKPYFTKKNVEYLKYHFFILFNQKNKEFLKMEKFKNKLEKLNQSIELILFRTMNSKEIIKNQFKKILTKGFPFMNKNNKVLYRQWIH